MLFLTRPVIGPDGHPISFVRGAISLAYFSDFFKAINPDGRTSMTLLRRDGTVLAAHPAAEELIGSHLPDDSPWYQILANGGGFYRSAELLSGAARSTAMRPLRDYPLVIDVVLREDIPNSTCIDRLC